MRFMIIRKADQDTEAGAMPSEQLLADMLSYNEELVKAGVMLTGDGLRPSSEGARVTFKDGEVSITDGPFAEAKELIAGFSLIQAKSKEEAIEWVKRWPASDGHGNAEIEIRQVIELDDFGDELTPVVREQHARLREQTAQRD